MPRTRKIVSTALGLVVLSGLTTSGCTPREVPVVEVDPVAQSRADALAVVDRFIETIGGTERLKEKRPTRMIGKIDMMQMEGSMEVLIIPDGAFIQKMSFPSMGMESISGSDGTRGWTFNSFTGAELMPEAMHDQLRRDSDPSSILQFSTNYDLIEHTGEKEFEGETVEMVRVVDKAGLESIQFYSKASGLLIGGESDQDSPQGRVRVQSVVGGYQDFDGLMIATKTSVNMGPIAMEMEITSVVTGDIEPEEMIPPKPVQKLLERTAEKEAESADSKKDETPEDDGENGSEGG